MPLPTDANVDLLLCDAVRQTPEGKLDIAGYFPAPMIKLDSAASLPAAINLTFVYVLKDGDGRFKPVFRILDPVGKELHRGDVEEFVKLPDHPHVIFLRINHIPVYAGGNFAILLQLGDEEYRRLVRIYQ